MFHTAAVGPPIPPSKLRTDPDWPIYPCLERHLLTRDGQVCPGCGEVVGPVGDVPDRTIAHALAVCAAYAYAHVEGAISPPNTLAQMASNIGLQGNRTLCVGERIDASFVKATGFLIQSRDGEVAILCFRGTEPYSIGSWMTDADIDSETRKLRIGIDGTGGVPVHPGFYRNTRAIDHRLTAALDLALAGESILAGTGLAGHDDQVKPLKALYITGHSLGGAMAAMMGLLVLNDPARASAEKLLRGVYTYGQPMIGGPELAAAVRSAGQEGRFTRFVYKDDVVAWVPPRGLGSSAWEHFGRGLQIGVEGAPRPITISSTSLEEMVAGVFDLAAVHAPGLIRASLPAPIGRIASLIAERLRRKSSLTIRDHLPLHYVRALARTDSLSEFGDYPVLTR